MKVLHVLYNYYPDLTGSTIRSEGILKGQVHNGIDVVAVTSPFQEGYSVSDYEILDGIKVYRAKNSIDNNLEISEKEKPLFSRLKKVFLIFKFYSYLRSKAEVEAVDVIHAHSMFYCALPSILVARKLKIKSIYEFRSLWEERFKSKGVANFILSKLIKAIETLSLKLADQVVTINKSLRDDLVSRGVNPNKIFIVPNAVENDILELAAGVSAPKQVKRFGYVGNFSEIEGLELLISAFEKAFPISDFTDTSLTFFGKGPSLNKLNEIVSNSSDKRIMIKGAFSRKDLVDIYTSLDCIVIARLNLDITQKVTPLKPLEAMAFKRLVIGSDVGGVKEVISGTDNALFFEAENVSDLSERLLQSYNGDNSKIISSGTNFVLKNRSWNNVANIYKSIY
ncbi:glycosyltransferase family 4 protein [Vibrio lentus]